MASVLASLRQRIDRILNQNKGALKHLITVFLLSTISNIFTVAFYFIMSRKLGPEGYSEFGVLLAIFQVASVTTGVIGIVIVRYISYFKAKSQYDKISMLLRSSMKYLFAVGFLVFIVLTLFSGSIARLFDISSQASIIILALFIWSYLFIICLLSVLNGLQRYVTLGLNRIFDAISTLLLGIFLVYVLKLFVTGALFGLLLGVIVTIPFCLWSLRNIMVIKTTPLGKIGLTEYIALAAITSWFVGMLLNIDVMMIKYFFSQTEGGFYAAISLVGSIVFFMSNALNTIIFPKVSELYSNGEDTASYLRFGLFWTVIGCLIVVLTYFIAPDFIVRIALGSRYDVSRYIGLYALAMSMLAMTNIIVVYNLAIKRWSILYILIPGLFVEMLLIYLFHATLFMVVMVVLFFHTALLVSLLILCWDQIEDTWYARQGYKKFPSSLQFRLQKN